MAISRGAGTEIIRSASFEAVNQTGNTLIFGVKHHIYTVLSVVCHAKSVGGSEDFVRMYLYGYDSKAGGSGGSHQDMYIFQQSVPASGTFVWNDKFSFNGHEPTPFNGAMNDATKQDAIADQGSTVAQELRIDTENGSDFDVFCTFIDQNNA